MFLDRHQGFIVYLNLLLSSNRFFLNKDIVVQSSPWPVYNNLDQLSSRNIGFAFFNLDWCLFHLIVFLKLDLNSYNSFELSWVDKVTTGAQSFASVISIAKLDWD